MADREPERNDPNVWAAVATDKTGLMNDDKGHIPWQFKASGQEAGIFRRVADKTVVVDYATALGMGGYRPGRRAIVLAQEHAQRPPSQRPYIERCLPYAWRGTEVAYSIAEVLAKCQSERTICVLGGRSAFIAFWPYTSTVYRFVLNDAPIASAQAAGAHFCRLPGVPSSTEASSTEYRVETYRIDTTLAVPPCGAPNTAAYDDRSYERALGEANSVWSRSSDQSDAASASVAAGGKGDFDETQIEVYMMAAVDKRNLMNDSTACTPWQFRGSGQIAGISQRVANETVVVSYLTALAMGERPPGRRVIVLVHDYSLSCKAHMERYVTDTWPDVEVAYSVPEVFAKCRNERALYVLGGESAFAAFGPYASTICKFVLSGHPIPLDQTTDMRAYFPTLPCVPSSVETPSDQYSIETYKMNAVLTAPLRDPTAVATHDYVSYERALEAANKMWSRSSSQSNSTTHVPMQAEKKSDSSETPTGVCLMVAVDRDDLMENWTGRAPPQFEHSGQNAAIYRRVANETVVMGYLQAVLMDKRPPGRRVIVLAHNYSLSRKAHIERCATDTWPDVEVAYSVPEVFARCRGERTIYVLGGESTFLAFRPYASTICKFVLDGEPIPLEQTTDMRARFSLSPNSAPSSVETPSDQYHIETYRVAASHSTAEALLHSEQFRVSAHRDEALEQALQESLKDAPPKRDGDALGDTDYWQFLIQEFDRAQRQKAGAGSRRPCNKKNDIKGKAKLSDDDGEDNALFESEPDEEPVTARGLVIRSTESADVKHDTESFGGERDDIVEDQDFLIDSDVEYDPDDYIDSSDDDVHLQEGPQERGILECST